MDILTPDDFVGRWRGTSLSERASYQSHFFDLCKLAQHETPKGDGIDSHGRHYAFEYGLKKDTGGQGFADVFYEGHFAIEYKAPGKYKDLSEAYQQLLQYREKLNNPPLLIVTDIENWEIHTNWQNTEKRVYTFQHEDIARRPSIQRYLTDIFKAPDRLHPRRNTEQVTADAARGFQMIADNMRQWEAAPERIAHFLTKIVFCLFAEDVALLPPGPKGETGIFSEIIERTKSEPQRFIHYTNELFQAMADGGEVLFAPIPYFNGSLFDDVRVEELSFEALTALERAANLNWESIEPAIFGTLFERSLDPGKRAQLGAHYTSREDINLIVEPVLMQPLRREWDTIITEATPIREKYETALKGSNKRQIKTHGDKLAALREQMLNRLRTITVLDPACGSGNFLYISLQHLMDMEKEVLNHELFAGLTKPFPEVHPRQMFGMEINPIAHALASIVVWIGYIQWRKQNGYYNAINEPILEDLHDNIRLMDAIMQVDADATEPTWHPADVIVGNPPFLGAKRMKGELGDEYVDQLHKLYEGRLPGFTDLVAYWFEKARSQVEQGHTKRVGLLATNSIGMGTNLPVMKRIKESGDIFMAWSDRDWILEGAAVRIAMIGFDDGSDERKILNNIPVETINANLTATVDLTQANSLPENSSLSFIGNQKSGPFDIDADFANELLKAKNKTNVLNSAIVRPWVNGEDIVRRPRQMYVIVFDKSMSHEDVKQFEKPYQYVKENVSPKRTAKHFQNFPFWLHWRTRPELFQATNSLKRYIGTPLVSKHRVFVWLSKESIPSNLVVAIAREDDYFFGVLHSKLHEVWSLRMGTWLGKGNDPRYTPTTTFETFPFPWSPGQEDTDSAAYQAISAAAQQLHTERDAWLNPDGLSEKALKERTLTNLYNALAVFRGQDAMKIKVSAGEFAPRLAELHDALDRAVCDAYGWDHAVLDDDETILRHLLDLNLQRATT